MEGTMGSICPQAEININKKEKERHKNKQMFVTLLGRPYDKIRKR
jgi:hypothetical protein